MSIKVMSQVWERSDLDPYERLVVLCLADHANDEGVCYPSVGRLCDRTGMKERGVQNVIKRLSERGILTVEKNAGMKGANLYTINETPAPGAPRTECTPAPGAGHPAPNAPAPDAPPPHPITSTPAPGAPEPSRTVNNISSKGEAREIRDALCSVASPDAATSFIRFRSKSKNPLTATAAKRIATTLIEIRNQGGDPDDALGLAEERGWRSIQPEWYFKNRPSLGASGRSSRADPSMDAIQIAARSRRSPGAGGF